MLEPMGVKEIQMFSENLPWGKKIFEGSLPFPDDKVVGNYVLPNFFIGDDAFPLQKIFNYRLSRARRCVENAFGIMSSKFYCLSRKTFCSPEKSQKITTACCYLHNFLLNNFRNDYCPPNYEDRYDERGNLILGDYHNFLPCDPL